ncbi:isocitrate lyase/PEP mutase family protein [Microvirga antarctica]|uniref:isocitrate lyase/PEP mutase family protein n=1 Tax=Microvirga antarctica TaxID=2819233 RepID=UPI001B304CF6|nr:oxaloacetate decarboxylase [Microvirga antarctica]
MSGSATSYPLGLRIAAGRNASLRNAVASGKIVVAPGAFDCLTARLVERAGFGALYVTGSGVSISALGAPDVGLMSFGEILDRVKRIADSVAIPLIADADTGYGGPLNVIRTIREFERAGVSAIQIEDQMWPKKCGHEADRQLASVDEMVGRIKAAVDARVDEDLIIVARTDARSEQGLDAAIERAQIYAEAGADVLFVESPESASELKRVATEISRPVLANMVEGGRTPITPAAELQDFGFRIVIYPNALTRTIARAGADMLAALSRDGTTASWKDRMVDHRELWSLFDYETWTATEKRFAVPPTSPGK